MPPHPLTNFEIQNIIKMSLDLMVFVLEIIYKKYRMGHIYKILMSTLILELIGLLFMYKITMLLILILSE